MKAPEVRTQRATGNTSQESKIDKEGLNMKAQTEEAEVQKSPALGYSVGTRFFRVVALGALLVGATVLYSSMSQGEAGSQPESNAAIQDFEVEELEAPVIGVAAYLSSQTAAAVQAPAPEFRTDLEWDGTIEQRDLIKYYQAMGVRWEFDEFGNVVELPGQTATYMEFDPAEWSEDQLSKHFVGIPLSSEEIEAWNDEERLDGMLVDMLMGLPAGGAVLGGQAGAYYEEFEYDQLSKNFLGIPLTSKQVQQMEQVELIRERIELIEGLEEMGVPWHMDDQGRVVFGVPFIAGKEEAALSMEEMEVRIGQDWCQQEVDPPDCL